MTNIHTLQRSYDRVAAAYTAHIADELTHKPLDRALLTCFAEQVGTTGLVYDLGCGPGHVGSYLADAGLHVQGIDVSAGMIAEAQQRYPDMAFSQGDLRSLTVADGTLAGVVAFYAIVHLQAEELVLTFREWWRVLHPHGRVLLAFHVGNTIVHRDALWDQPVDLDFHFFQSDVVAAALQQAQFHVDAVVRRDPYPEVEHPSERAYLLCSKAGAP